MANQSTVDVFCGWGIGPDVGVNITRDKETGGRYPVTFIPLDFNADEAERIGRALINAACEARRLDGLARGHAIDATPNG